MPSDPICDCPDAVKEAAGASLADFRSSLATTVGILRASLAQLTGDEKKKKEIAEKSLGSFADGRIDVTSFDQYAVNKSSVDAAAGPVLERALDVLVELMDAGEALTHRHLNEGMNLRCLVNRTLKEIGRAFGAVQAVELAKAGLYDEAEHGSLFEGYMHKHWTPAQRELAPAIVVRLADGSAQTTNLSEFVDGHQKVVLVYGEDCPPAPLARLICPGMFVVQTTDCLGLEDFLAYEGPGVAAVVPATAARFSHDPRIGATLASRLSHVEFPDQPELRARGGLSLRQQVQDLEHLKSLSSAQTPEAAEDVSNSANPVDKLAAYLLGKAHLEEV